MSKVQTSHKSSYYRHAILFPKHTCTNSNFLTPRITRSHIAYIESPRQEPRPMLRLLDNTLHTYKIHSQRIHYSSKQFLYPEPRTRRSGYSVPHCSPSRTSYLVPSTLALLGRFGPLSSNVSGRGARSHTLLPLSILIYSKVFSNNHRTSQERESS